MALSSAEQEKEIPAYLKAFDPEHSYTESDLQQLSNYLKAAKTEYAAKKNGITSEDQKLQNNKAKRYLDQIHRLVSATSKD
jgi:hypothetical protein